ncbi:YuzF family protein [Pontibacillus yanchengensis]|nr:YuzF family protein [Pontibacillus yanchengensis]
MYYPYQDQRVHQQMNTQLMTLVDPYVVHTLQSVVGNMLIVETTKDTIRGKLIEVKPDHIVLTAGDSTFFVRIQQIVTIMPDR